MTTPVFAERLRDLTDNVDVILCVDLARAFYTTEQRFLATVGLASVISMAAAGMFEYNFGDSEFLMLFLGLITLPYAAARGREQQKGGPATPGLAR